MFSYLESKTRARTRSLYIHAYFIRRYKFLHKYYVLINISQVTQGLLLGFVRFRLQNTVRRLSTLDNLRSVLNRGTK
jgi:hypothetical protein